MSGTISMGNMTAVLDSEPRYTDRSVNVHFAQ